MTKITTQLFGELAVLPFPAERPVNETLEWLTDIMESQNGNEQRLQLRTKPRHDYSYSVPVQAWNVAKSFNAGYGALRRLWAVPLWTEAQYVGTVAENAMSINCNITDYDLRDNSIALLWRDDRTWEIIEISSLGEAQINLIAGATAISGAWLMPVRLGYISGNFNRRTNGHNGKVNLTFDLEDSLQLTAPAPAQYLDKDVYYTPSLLESSSSERTLLQRSDIFDPELGKVARRSPWTNARQGSNYRTITTDAAEMRAYKQFLYRRSGKFRDFWLPTFEQHLRPVNVGNIGSTLTIEADGFNDYTFRPHLAFVDMAGNWHPRAVSNPTPSIANRLHLTLDSALNIDAGLIANVCYLGLHRFDSDRIEISWIGNNVAEANVRILELAP